MRYFSWERPTRSEKDSTSTFFKNLQPNSSILIPRGSHATPRVRRAAHKRTYIHNCSCYPSGMGRKVIFANSSARKVLGIKYIFISVKVTSLNFKAVLRLWDYPSFRSERKKGFNLEIIQSNRRRKGKDGPILCKPWRASEHRKTYPW